jgi:hypothetical protein
LWELGPLTVFDDINQVINSGERCVPPLDCGFVEKARHGQLGVSLEQWESGVNLCTKLLFNLQFEGHKVFHERMKVKSDTVVWTQENIE